MSSFNDHQHDFAIDALLQSSREVHAYTKALETISNLAAIRSNDRHEENIHLLSFIEKRAEDALLLGKIINEEDQDSVGGGG
tara:strand:- start:23 stop:268 length:246 start_codon:yes stop_codon:yes gene_type:complete